MLSILIPVYNFNVVELVRGIHRQAMQSGVNFEIIVMDDGSEIQFKEKNRIIKEWRNLRYEELSENIGRAKIRNKMATMAGFPWLLFLDCDTQVVRSDYIATYLGQCHNEGVICGGRTYRDIIPENPEQYLRWKYGRSREQKSAAYRNRRPWNSFMTNNFVISRSLFDLVTFNESITQYGHEDTFFGTELRRKGISVTHIDNPLVHIGLETHDEFLVKTNEGIENLLLLLQTNEEYRDELISGIKLLKHFYWLKKTRTTIFYILFYTLFKKLLLLNIKSHHPCLLLFDLYKLGFLIEKERTFTKNSENSQSLA
ncbi:MAG: glycosyltransferase [Bacteroidales bacterium]|nr:glycosyltransferase [Bacteroidales bacterium]